jgi:hypothetical protein
LLVIDKSKKKQRVVVIDGSSWLEGKQGTLVPLPIPIQQQLILYGQNSQVFGVDFDEHLTGHAGNGTPTSTHNLLGVLRRPTGSFFLKHEIMAIG